VAGGEPVEHGEVEVDHVPAGEHVGIQRADAGREARQEFLSVGKGRALSGQRKPAG